MHRPGDSSADARAPATRGWWPTRAITRQRVRDGERLARQHVERRRRQPARVQRREQRVDVDHGAARGVDDDRPRTDTGQKVGTDHAPHSPDEKDREFDYAPNGITGLETALPVCLDILVRQNRFKLPHVIDLMTRKAANLLKLPAGTLAPGAEADVCIFDPNETWLYDAKQGFSKSLNSPWSGRKLTGRVKTTIVSGRIIYQNGQMR